jgi:hypothetical protein
LVLLETLVVIGTQSDKPLHGKNERGHDPTSDDGQRHRIAENRFLE